MILLIVSPLSHIFRLDLRLLQNSLLQHFLRAQNYQVQTTPQLSRSGVGRGMVKGIVLSIFCKKEQHLGFSRPMRRYMCKLLKIILLDDILMQSPARHFTGYGFRSFKRGLMSTGNIGITTESLDIKTKSTLADLLPRTC